MDTFQREVIDRLARLETKLDAVPDLERRVTDLERGNARFQAITALVAAMLSGFAATVGALIGRS